jgi:hypothetical protein
VWTNSHDARTYRNAQHSLRADYLASIWNLSGGHLGLSALTSGICLVDIWRIHGPVLKSQRQNKWCGTRDSAARAGAQLIEGVEGLNWQMLAIELQCIRLAMPAIGNAMAGGNLLPADKAP